MKLIIFNQKKRISFVFCFTIKVINAYSSGVQAHKELLRKNGLTPDAVEDMIDEVHDVSRTFLVSTVREVFIISNLSSFRHIQNDVSFSRDEKLKFIVRRKNCIE